MNDEMNARVVPNWMLYDLIRDLKVDMDKRFEDVDRRFDEVDRKFDEVHKKFADVNYAIEKLETKVDKNSARIEDVYLNRDKVQVTFSRTFAFGTMFFSGLIAYVVALFNRN